MAKKKRRRRRTTTRYRRRRKRTIPLAPTLGVLAGVFTKPHAGAHNSPFGALMAKDYEGAMHLAVENYTGLYIPDGSFDITHAKGLMGLAVGLLVHKAVGWIGGNRVFANMPAPLDRLRI